MIVNSVAVPGAAGFRGKRVDAVMTERRCRSRCRIGGRVDRFGYVVLIVEGWPSPGPGSYRLERSGGSQNCGVIAPASDDLQADR